MKRLPTIRGRLSSALIGISVVWGVAVSAVVWGTVQHEVDELMDTTLQESAEIVYGLLILSAEHLDVAPGASLPAPPHVEHLIWQVVDAQGQVVLRSHTAPAQALVAARSSGWFNAGGQWRVYALGFGPAGRMLYVAQPTAERREARLEVAEFTAGGALLVGLLCALWLRSRVRRELEPIHRLSGAVAAYDPMAGAGALDAPQREELVPMHRAIVELGQRLARRIANERAFSAHAAHALRTPLAGMVMQLAVAQRRATPETRAQLDNTREAADRLQRVVTALLTMFRSGSEPRWQRVSLPGLLTYLRFGHMEVAAASGEIDADPDLLAAALMNLLDNSARHGARSAQVHLLAPGPAGGLRICDDGEGLTPERRAELQAALDSQDYEGRTGLGLMLADLVARAHGGRLQLLAGGSGCCIDLHLGPRPAPRPES